MSDSDIRDQLEGLFSDSVAGPEKDPGKDPTPPEPEAAAVDRNEAEMAGAVRHEPIPAPEADSPGNYSAPLALESRVNARASIQLRLIIGLILAAIVPLMIVGGWSLYTMQKANTQAVEWGEAAIIELAEAAIYQDAVATARQVELYLSMHPEVDLADMAQLENNTDLAEIAVQPVGQTGYTAVFDDKGITHFHANPAIVGMDMSTLAGEMPEFWGIFAASLDGSPSDGYYDWKDADGQIRPKYMSIVSVGDTPLRVAATTYIDEFAQPLVETRSQLADVQKAAVVQFLVILALVALVASVAGYGLGRRFSRPILQMAGAAARIAAGDLSPINLRGRRDEIGLLAHTLDSMVTELRETWASLEQRIAGRTHALELATQVGHRLSTVRDLDRLLAEAVELIRGSFGLYHVQVYLSDPAERSLALRASTGQAGAELLRRGHVLPIGPGSVNGAAAAQKQAVIISDTSGSPAFKPNPLLPDTRSEMAVPLLLGERVVGVLDLQSARPGALSAETLPAVEALAGQLAVAIDNARLFGELAQARAEVEAQLSRRASTGWGEFLDGIQRGERMGYACEGGNVQPLVEPLTATPEARTLTTPIRVQGVPVGAIQIEAEAGRAWTQAEAELVESVAHQVAQQAESLRLLAQAEAYRAEAEAASRRLTREGWAEYVQSQAESAAGFVYDLHQVQPLRQAPRPAGQPAPACASGPGDGQGEPLETNSNGRSSPPALTQALQVRGEPIGELAVDGVEALDDEAIQFLAAVAERLGDHLENLRLLEETQTRRYELEERSQELEASQRVTFAANETDDPDDLLDLVVNLIRDQFNLYHAQVYLVDTPPDAGRGQAAVLRKSTGYAGRQLIQAGHHIPLDHEASLVVKAIRTGQPVVVDDVSQEPEFMPNPLLPDTRSELVLPLKAGGQVLGALDVQDRTPGRFTPRTVTLFQTMAEQVAMNFESADLLKRTTEQAVALTRFATQLRAAAEVAERVSAILDPDQLMGEVVELLQSRFGLYHAHIYMLETSPSGGVQLAVRAGSGEVGKVLCERGHCIPLDAEKSLVARAARSRQMIYVDDTSLKSDFMPNPLLPQTRSEVALPLVVGDRVLGVLDVQDDQPGRFTESDLNVFGTLAGQVATALENARLFEEQKRAEAALRESQQMLQLVMDNVPQSIFWKDRDLVYLGCNREFAKDAGKELEEIIGKTDYDMPWVEQAELYRADDRRVMESGEPVLNYEEPQSTPTGDIIWLRTSKVPLRDARGEVMAVLGIYEDITDRKRAEQERERFTTQLSTAADVAAQVGAILDPDQLLNTVIPLLKERFGLYYAHFYMLDEAAGQLALRAGYGEPGRIMLERGHTIPLDAERSLVARAARSKEIVLANDVTQSPDFLPNPLLPETRSEVAVPAIAGGAVLGVFDVQHNVPGYFTEADLDVFQTLTGQITTALQNASLFEEIQQAAERLREVDRLKSEFLANMSHELRTPLNSILGYTEVMLMGLNGDLDAETVEDVQAIYDNGQHLLRLINDILDLAKIEAGRMALNIEEVEIAPLLEDVRTNNAGLLVNKPVEMILEMQEGLPAIKADRVRISQILNNLVSNAVKFTEQGRITMRAFAEDGERVCLEVEDTGIGIQESDLESIFEQFRQADGSFKRRAEGTGLGLAITRHLVHMHGGTINVRSQVGVGSTFTVHLPVQGRVMEAIAASDNGQEA